MWDNITLWVLAAYISLFVWQSLRQRQWLWLWLTVILWLGVGVASARLLPGLLGIEHLVNVYTPYVYVVPASLCLWLAAWRRKPGHPAWHMQRGGDYLALLAVSGVLQHLSFLLLLALVRYAYPHGLTLYVWPSLLYQYGLQPVYWIGCQWLLMALFYAHRRLLAQPATGFSWPQLQLGFLIALLLQVLFVVVDLGSRFAPG